MRVLAACSLGGDGHLSPLVPFLAAAQERGDETLVIGPPALKDMVDQAGFSFRAGGEPAEAEEAAIRERLPVAATRSVGTVSGYMSIASNVYPTALKAIEGMDVRALLTLGRKFDRSSLGPIPANVRVEAWVEQNHVLENSDLVVCHRGSGTVFGALAAGVPVVVVPLFADQFENARRIAEQGAGLIIEADQPSAAALRRIIGDADVPRIAEAITAVLATPSYRRRARLFAAEMAATETVGDVLGALLADFTRRSNHCSPAKPPLGGKAGQHG
jgi:UDP:flavonoid glycosyltransferase YjiC (YdhE family)